MCQATLPSTWLTLPALGSHQASTSLYVTGLSAITSGCSTLLESGLANLRAEHRGVPSTCAVTTSFEALSRGSSRLCGAASWPEGAEDAGGAEASDLSAPPACTASWQKCAAALPHALYACCAGLPLSCLRKWTESLVMA